MLEHMAPVTPVVCCLLYPTWEVIVMKVRWNFWGKLRMKDGYLWIGPDPVDEKTYNMDKSGHKSPKLTMRAQISMDDVCWMIYAGWDPKPKTIDRQNNARKCYIAIQNRFFAKTMKICRSWSLYGPILDHLMTQIFSEDSVQKSHLCTSQTEKRINIRSALEWRGCAFSVTMRDIQSSANPDFLGCWADTETEIVVCFTR